MQVDIPDQIIDSLRDALTPVIERLIDEKVQEKRQLLLSVTQVADELACSRASVYGLIRGGHLEAIQVGRTYKVPSEVLLRYVEELTRPKYQRTVISSSATGMPPRRAKRPANRRSPSSTVPEPNLVPATRPPRQPRPKKQRVSKKELAEQRWTVSQLGQRWWGTESASALIQRSGVVLSEESSEDLTFRYGDLLEWTDNNHEQFEQWVEEFDPFFRR